VRGVSIWATAMAMTETTASAHKRRRIMLN
jgi:hypothetical protein